MKITPSFFLLLSFFAILLMNCQNEEMNFTESQPIKEKTLNKFKRGIRGTYLSLTDSASLLMITQDRIIRNNGLSSKIHRADLDTMQNVVIFEDEILTIEEDDTLHWNLEWNGDTAKLVLFMGLDTLFEVSEQHILKYHKKKYFLNKSIGEGLWNVEILTLDENDELTILGLKGDEETISSIEAIFPIEEVQGNEQAITYVDRISKKEFLRLIDLNTVFVKGRYVKIDKVE